MLFEQRLRAGIRDGTITVAFRRWARPQVVAGRRYRTVEGLVLVEAVDEIDERDITADDVRAAGYPTRAALLADLGAGRPRARSRSSAGRGAAGGDRRLYRLRLRGVDEPDPRSVLAGDADLDATALAEIDRRLERLDRAAAGGPWTMAVLRTIAERPAVRAPDLAAGFGRETAPFKRDVRKLKDLGLTESLAVGYRLSPRGRAYVARRP